MFFTKNTIKLSNQKIKITPIRLEPFIELTLLIAPYIPLIEREWPNFQAGLSLTNGKRPEVLSALFRALATEMKNAPGDIIKILSLLIDKPIEWTVQNVTAQDILAALPIIDKVNGFDKILLASKQMVRFE